MSGSFGGCEIVVEHMRFCICACADILLWCCVSVCGLTFSLTQLANRKQKRQSESESADTCTPKRTYF